MLVYLIRALQPSNAQSKTNSSQPETTLSQTSVLVPTPISQAVLPLLHRCVSFRDAVQARIMSQTYSLNRQEIIVYDHLDIHEQEGKVISFLLANTKFKFLAELGNIHESLSKCWDMFMYNRKPRKRLHFHVDQ